MLLPLLLNLDMFTPPVGVPGPYRVARLYVHQAGAAKLADRAAVCAHQAGAEHLAVHQAGAEMMTAGGRARVHEE